jgi:hypothetical protein
MYIGTSLLVCSVCKFGDDSSPYRIEPQQHRYWIPPQRQILHRAHRQLSQLHRILQLLMQLMHTHHEQNSSKDCNQTTLPPKPKIRLHIKHGSNMHHRIVPNGLTG